MKLSFFVFLALLVPASIIAHDADSYGGLYRSRDAGATWLPADAGLYINSSNAIAISPTDSNDLLYGTDTKLMRSKNGGRDWHDQDSVVAGPIFCVAFEPQLNVMFAANATRLFRSDDGSHWHSIHVPLTSFPIAKIVTKNSDVYLAGNDGLYIGSASSEDWRGPVKGLPEEPISALLVANTTPQASIHAVLGGRVWQSLDRGKSWRQGQGDWRDQRIDTIAAHPGDTQTLWAAGASRLFKSNDGGATWQAHGNPLPDPNIVIRAIAVNLSGNVIVLSTHRGLMRSADGAQTWAKIESALPLHLEPGPLLQDHTDPNLMYVGFSLRPYGEAWRAAQHAAEQQRNDEARKRFSFIAAGIGLIALAAGLFWRRRNARSGHLEHKPG
jgi:photosystem II stability/assembly factor-like uncharacterized protein